MKKQSKKPKRFITPKPCISSKSCKKKARHMALAGTRLGITKQLSAREPQRVVGTQKKVDTL